MDGNTAYETNQGHYENAEAPNSGDLVEGNLTDERSLPIIEMPFYLMRPAPGILCIKLLSICLPQILKFQSLLLVVQEAVTGSTNLILHNERQHSFKQYCCKKVKESLKAFLTHCPGNIDTPAIFMSDDELKETW